MDDLSHHDIGELSEVIRPLNSLEHLFWLGDQNRPFHFAVTAQVSGETSVRDWREALARAARNWQGIGNIRPPEKSPL
jgi:hypothetical protein